MLYRAMVVSSLMGTMLTEKVQRSPMRALMLIEPRAPAAGVIVGLGSETVNEGVTFLPLVV